MERAAKLPDSRPAPLLLQLSIRWPWHGEPTLQTPRAHVRRPLGGWVEATGSSGTIAGRCTCSSRPRPPSKLPDSRPAPLLLQLSIRWPWHGEPTLQTPRAHVRRPLGVWVEATGSSGTIAGRCTCSSRPRQPSKASRLPTRAVGTCASVGVGEIDAGTLPTDAEGPVARFYHHHPLQARSHARPAPEMVSYRRRTALHRLNQ